jgi:hypothetical protein
LPNDPYPQTPRIADQRDQIGNIIVAQTSNSEPRGFDDHLGRFGRNGCAPIGGVLRGLTRSGVNVTARTKVIEATRVVIPPEYSVWASGHGGLRKVS